MGQQVSINTKLCVKRKKAFPLLKEYNKYIQRFNQKPNNYEYKKYSSWNSTEINLKWQWKEKFCRKIFSLFKLHFPLESFLVATFHLLHNLAGSLLIKKMHQSFSLKFGYMRNSLYSDLGVNIKKIDLCMFFVSYLFICIR